MPKTTLYDMSGAQIGELELNEDIFGIEPNEAVMADFVKMQLANKRQGSSSTKTRAEVRGGGRKPWRQKGTGRARVGSTRNPIWVGGGVTFGPKPKDYSYRLPKKVRRLAFKSALSTKVKENSIVVVDKLSFEEPKTKLMLETLDALKIFDNVLIVTLDGDVNVTKSARNISGVKPMRVDYLNVYDLLKYDTLLITKDAIERVEEVFA